MNNFCKFSAFYLPTILYRGILFLKDWMCDWKSHKQSVETRVDEFGIRWTFLDGKYHREGGPAVEYLNGTKSWYLNGERLSLEDYIQELKARGKEDAVINLLFNLDSV